MSKRLLFLALFVLTLRAAAATLQGTVKDPSGALIAGAEVTASGTGTNGNRSVKTDALGHFSIDGLAPGQYQITVKYPGFEDAQRAVSITQDEKFSADFELKIQAQEATVEATGKRSSLANADPNYRALRDGGLVEFVR